jgi:hypothetical protein
MMEENIQQYFGSEGSVIAADNVGGVKHLRTKLQFGSDGSATDVSYTTRLPILTLEEAITSGLIANFDIVNKFGRNPDTDTGTIPEDVWNGSGPYTGFPTGSPEQLEIVLSSASDVGGTVVFQYLASATSTVWQTGTVITTGLNTLTGITAYRMHSARFEALTSTAFNVGTVTIRHATTTANIFCTMPIGTSQTYVAAYTVPYNAIGIIRRSFAYVYANTTGSVQGALWVREPSRGPRLRRPFSCSDSHSFEEMPYGGLVLPGMTDVSVRLTQVSANNLSVIAGFDIIIIPQS